MLQSMEAAPQKREPLHARLEVSVRNPLQTNLIERYCEEAHADPMKWVTENAKLFDTITFNSKKLRELARRDPVAAEAIIRWHLEMAAGIPLVAQRNRTWYERAEGEETRPLRRRGKDLS